MWVRVAGAILAGVQARPPQPGPAVSARVGAVPVTTRSLSPLGPSRFRAVSLSGDLDHAEAEHVLHGPAAGEGGLRDVLPGCGAVPQLLLALPHRLLSLGESLTDLFQVSRENVSRAGLCTAVPSRDPSDS